ncbi:uncharacterized protein [Rutidosis leptorrhynchoides]|uniref:uncharacterized protein n=1 Tax=Rutidosis leptorrhynchoides TaxID=125765 RepID=UPI003A993BC5
MLFQDKVDFGPTYFKIFDSWFDRDDFDDTVHVAWETISMDSNLDIVAKFRLLKGHLKSWIHNSRSSEAKRLKEITSQIDELDNFIDAGVASEDDVQRRNKLASEKNDLTKFIDLDYLQKARVRWDVEGDENSKKFQFSLKRTRRLQHIQGLLVDGTWIDNPKDIKDCFFEHFKSKFDAHDSDFIFDDPRPRMVLTESECSMLEVDIEDDEIKKSRVALRDIRGFFSSCSMPRGANSAFFSLIPKIYNPMLITDFRPISLVGCFYKTVTKILTNRLQGVIDNIISPVQTTFIAGRQILDGPLMLSESIDWYKRKNKKMLMFKVDFEKAYDSVNWEYLLSMLSILEFGDKWCSWIKGCLFSARTSVLVNGSPTREFPLKRGLRQGDPLSPFLFIIVMEGLHLAFHQAMERNIIHGINVGTENISLSHFIYVDDVVIFSDWNAIELRRILLILEVFHKNFGFKVEY